MGFHVVFRGVTIGQGPILYHLAGGSSRNRKHDRHHIPMDKLRIRRLNDTFAVLRLDPSAPIPAWANRPGKLLSITRTCEELSIIAPQSLVPDQAAAQRDYLAYALVGPLDFALVGVLARLTAALADARVPVLAISTYDTDILLIRADQREPAEAALAAVAALQS